MLTEAIEEGVNSVEFDYHDTLDMAAAIKGEPMITHRVEDFPDQTGEWELFRMQFIAGDNAIYYIEDLMAYVPRNETIVGPNNDAHLVPFEHDVDIRESLEMGYRFYVERPDRHGRVIIAFTFPGIGDVWYTYINETARAFGQRIMELNNE